MDLTDTIVAIASAPGGALRGVVRLSGPQAIEIVSRIVDLPASRWLTIARSLPTATRANVKLTTDPVRQLPVDLFVWPGNRSYTREPTVELHTLGSPPLLDRLVASLCESGARLAEPGEFTLRAFYAGRIDLTQAEAVLGVIDAEGPDALQTALGQLAGGMAEPLGALREELLLLLADLEAGLDFADEQIEFIAPQVLTNRLASALSRVESLVGQLSTRQVSTDLPRVVLVGPTNAGKSSLFNAMVAHFGDSSRTPAALVSPTPGATRDYLTAKVTCDGIACELVDTAGTAGLAPEQSVEASAQTAADSARREAALVLVCTTAGAAADAPSPRTPLLEGGPGRGVVDVLTKVDLLGDGSLDNSSGAVVTSAVTGDGLDRLATTIATRITEASTKGAAAMVPSTALRSEASLRSALDSLSEASKLAARQVSEELVAAELRLALNHLGQVAGAVYTDDVLDRVFSRFCIGK